MIRWQALLGMYGATRCIALWPAEARSAMDGKPSPAGYSSCVHTTRRPTFKTCERGARHSNADTHSTHTHTTTAAERDAPRAQSRTSGRRGYRFSVKPACHMCSGHVVASVSVVGVSNS